MSEYQNFEEEEEALFADDNITTDSQQKGTRLVPHRIMSDFIAWLDEIHPEIRGVHHLNQQNILYLIDDFESENGFRSGYTADEWLKSLQRL